MKTIHVFLITLATLAFTYKPIVGMNNNGKRVRETCDADFLESTIQNTRRNNPFALSRASQKLLAAVEHEDEFKAAEAIREGADVNCTYREERTPLHVAVSSGYIPTINLLLDQSDLNIDAQDSLGRTALHCALEFNGLFIPKELADATSAQLVQLLLNNPRHRINPNLYTHNNCSPIDTTITHKRPMSLSPLCRYKYTNINEVDRHGFTPLIFAATINNIQSVKTLIGHGANLEIPDSSGKTAAQLAAHGSETHKLLTDPKKQAECVAAARPTILADQVANNNQNLYVHIKNREHGLTTKRTTSKQTIPIE